VHLSIVAQSTLWQAYNKEVVCFSTNFPSCWYFVLTLAIRLVVLTIYCDINLSFKWFLFLLLLSLVLTLQDPSKQHKLSFLNALAMCLHVVHNNFAIVFCPFAENQVQISSPVFRDSPLRLARTRGEEVCL
jgi:hypothetical protein